MSEIHSLEKKSLPETCYVFKHSTACPVSARAAEVVRGVSELPLPVYWINVIEQRELSNWVAEHYSVTHQSPQLILVRDGAAAGDWSHSAITAELLKP